MCNFSLDKRKFVNQLLETYFTRLRTWYITSIYFFWVGWGGGGEWQWKVSIFQFNKFSWLQFVQKSNYREFFVFICYLLFRSVHALAISPTGSKFTQNMCSNICFNDKEAVLKIPSIFWVIRKRSLGVEGGFGRCTSPFLKIAQSLTISLEVGVKISPKPISFDISRVKTYFHPNLNYIKKLA